MFAKLNSMNVHLDLDLNRYSATSVEGEPVDFNAKSKIFRDVSAQAFEGSADVRLIPRFQWSTVAARALRWKSMRYISQTAIRCSQRMAANSTTTPTVISHRLATYNRLKTYRVFQASCIPDALACLFFLADLRCAANFVVGVQERPFRAHAWLEINGLVANDLVANVFDYIPILQTADEDHAREILRGESHRSDGL